MKYLAFLLVFIPFFWVNSLFSQDTILIKNNIVESDLTLIETEGLAVKIDLLGCRYYFVDQQIKKHEFATIISANSSAKQKYIVGTNLRLFGKIIAIPSAFAAGVIYLVNGYDYEGQDQQKGFGLSAGLFFTGVVMTAVGGSMLKSAAIEYNSSEKFGLNIGLQEHGVGVVFRF